QEGHPAVVRGVAQERARRALVRATDIPPSTSGAVRSSTARWRVSLERLGRETRSPQTGYVDAMLIPFFFKLREAGVPVSITEFLTLQRALQARVAAASAEDFYYLARACMVKDERHFDRFDRAFAAHFKGAEELFAAIMAKIPEEW